MTRFISRRLSRSAMFAAGFLALGTGALPARAADTCPLPRKAAVHHTHKIHHEDAIVADAAPPMPACQSYHRAVAFPAGGVREAAGTACLGEDGVWRVADEHLVQGVRPVPVYEEAVYPAPVYTEPVYAEAVYAGPVYAPYYEPAYAPAFVSFGFGYGGRWHGGHGWRG